MTTGDKNKFEAMMNRVTVACSFIGTNAEKDALKMNFWNYLKRWNLSEVESAMDKFINSLYSKERDGNPNPRDVESFIVCRAKPMKKEFEDNTVYTYPDWFPIEHHGKEKDALYQYNFAKIWRIFMHVSNININDAQELGRYWNKTGKIPDCIPAEYIPKEGIQQVPR